MKYRERLFLFPSILREKSITLPMTVSAEELEVMGRTLSNTAASITDEIATAKTLYKLKDTPFMDEINAVVGKRIKGLFDNIAGTSP